MLSARSSTPRQSWADLLVSWRSIALNVLVLIATLVLMVSLVANWSGAYSIEPISVPDEFSKQKEAKEAISAALRDEIGRIVKTANNGVVIKPIVRDSIEPQITVIGTTFPVQYLLDSIRWLTRTPVIRIGGQLSRTDDKPPVTSVLLGHCESEQGSIRLVLHRTDSITGPFFDCRSEYPKILRSAALAALEQIDPLTLAGFLGQGDELSRHRAIAIVQDFLHRTRSIEWTASVQRSFGLTTEIPRAELVLANIYLSGDDREKAEMHFQHASDEFAARQADYRPWSPALDGIAVTRLLRKDFAGAEEKTKEALLWEPRYDSALYHDAELMDRQSRNVFSDFNAPNTCNAILLLKEAENRYAKLLDLHSDFSIAYNNLGVMLLQMAAYIRVNGNLGCGYRKSGTEKDLLAELDDKIVAALGGAVARDAALWESWFQWGILLYQKQKPSFFPWEPLDNNNRISLLKQAIAKYDVALKLVDDNPYIWRLRGEAEEVLATLDAANVKESRRFAVRSFCNAEQRSRTGQGQSEHGPALEALARLGVDKTSCLSIQPRQPYLYGKGIL
jgi:tetratricopeptide (TPR) repeat protein